MSWKRRGELQVDWPSFEDSPDWMLPVLWARSTTSFRTQDHCHSVTFVCSLLCTHTSDSFWVCYGKLVMWLQVLCAHWACCRVGAWYLCADLTGNCTDATLRAESLMSVTSRVMWGCLGERSKKIWQPLRPEKWKVSREWGIIFSAVAMLLGSFRGL